MQILKEKTLKTNTIAGQFAKATAAYDKVLEGVTGSSILLESFPVKVLAYHDPRGGRPALLLELHQATQPAMPEVNGIEYLYHPSKGALVLSWLDSGEPSRLALFVSSFLTQAIEEEDEEGVLSVLRSEIWKWQRLFSNKRVERLSKSKAIRLYAEMLVTRDYLAPNFSGEELLQIWRLDFENQPSFVFHNKKSLEVFNKKLSSSVIAVSRIARLDPESGVTQAWVYSYSKASKATQSLLSLAEEVGRIFTDKGIAAGLYKFILLSMGFDIEDVAYSDYAWNFKAPEFLSITEDFPSLKRSTLHKEIVECSYSLSTNELVPFYIESSPLVSLLQEGNNEN